MDSYVSHKGDSDQGDNGEVVIVTIPLLKDLQSLKERGQPPLPAWFGEMSRQLSFTSLDLLLVLAANPSDGGSYYHDCDKHWTSKANALVVQALRRFRSPRAAADTELIRVSPSTVAAPD